MIFLCNVLILVFLAGDRELSYKEVRWDQKCVFVVHFWDRWQNFVFCRFIRQHWGLRNYTVVLKWLFKETSNMKKVWIFWFILPIHTVFPSPAPNLQNDEKKIPRFYSFPSYILCRGSETQYPHLHFFLLWNTEHFAHSRSILKS